MNTRSINRLRKNFITVAMVSFLLVMLFTGVLINAATIVTTRNDARQILDLIASNEGELPEISVDSTADRESDGTYTSSTAFSPEFPYSTRYFAVIFDKDGNVDSLKTSHIAAVTESLATVYAEKVLNNYFAFGKYGDFYYLRQNLSDSRVITVFLDYSQQVNTNNAVIRMTVLICASGFLITLVLVILFSGRMIRPEIENARRQKQFITNASHELKTPLAVIRANTEIEEMMNGESEWTQSTMRQVDRLSGLIQNLVMITRAEETEDRSVLSRIDVSAAVEESVAPYASLAQQEKKELVRQISPDVKMVADGSKIRQLTTLLIDNAFKYCDEGGTVSVSLDTQKKGKLIRLVVSNNFADGANVNYSKFFERFYRQDQAHNVDAGGYGIGLSIAESIVHSYNGTIDASWKDGIISFTCLLS